MIEKDNQGVLFLRYSSIRVEELQEQHFFMTCAIPGSNRKRTF
jgi:hypothetical protein